MTARPAFRFLARLVLPVVLVLAGCNTSQPMPTAPPVPADTSSFAFVPEAPPAYTYDGLRVATLNAEFLFDGMGDEGQASFPHKGDSAAARAHRDRIGALVRMLDADLLMLQEVEHLAALQMLADESLADLGYAAYLVDGEDTFTGQDVGLLSRVPVEAVGRTDARVETTEGKSQGVSKNFWARVTLGDVPTTLIGLHLYARPSDVDRKPRREAQAEVIRLLAEQEAAAGRALIVLGDFNDYESAVPDRAGNVPITDVLARIRSVGPGEADDLHNVMADVPQAERYTSHWDRDRDDRVDEDELSAIDHILLSPALHQQVREVTFVQAHDPLTMPDHFPIVVTFAFDAP